MSIRWRLRCWCRRIAASGRNRIHVTMVGCKSLLVALMHYNFSHIAYNPPSIYVTRKSVCTLKMLSFFHSPHVAHHKCCTRKHENNWQPLLFEAGKKNVNERISTARWTPKLFGAHQLIGCLGWFRV